jgi:hypothetical protein
MSGAFWLVYGEEPEEKIMRDRKKSTLATYA